MKRNSDGIRWCVTELVSPSFLDRWEHSFSNKKKEKETEDMRKQNLKEGENIEKSHFPCSWKIDGSPWSLGRNRYSWTRRSCFCYQMQWKTVSFKQKQKTCIFLRSNFSTRWFNTRYFLFFDHNSSPRSPYDMKLRGNCSYEPPGTF